MALRAGTGAGAGRPRRCRRAPARAASAAVPAAPAPGRRRCSRGLLLYLAFPPVDVPRGSRPSASPRWRWPAAASGCAGAARCSASTTGLAFFLPLRRVDGHDRRDRPRCVALALLQAAVPRARWARRCRSCSGCRAGRCGPPRCGCCRRRCARGCPFGGFPWGRLAFSQGDSLLTPLAALGGAPLVSSRRGAARRRARLALLHLRARPVAALGACSSRPARRRSAARRVVPLPVAGEPRAGRGRPGQRAAAGAGLQRPARRRPAPTTSRRPGALAAGRPGRPRRRAPTWWSGRRTPPTSTRSPTPRRYALIDAAVRDVGVPVLVGAVLQGPGDKVSNAGIVWDPVDGPGRALRQAPPGAVRRVHPVPLARAPRHRQGRPRPARLRRRRPRSACWTSGRCGSATSSASRWPTTTSCATRSPAGGRLLVVQTNNATFGRSGETAQQLAMGRLRAVEHGRAVLVAATSGISAVIAPDGRLVSTRRRCSRRDVLVGRRAAAHRTDARHPAGRAARSWSLSLLALAAARRRRVRRSTAVSRPPRPRARRRPDLRRAREPRGRSPAGCTPPCRRRDLLVVDDGSPDGTGRARRRARRGRRRGCTSCTAPRRPGSARPTSPASPGRASTATTSSSRWTPTARTRPSSCRGCWRRSSDADLVLGSRWVPGGRGRQLAALARAAQPRRQRLHPPRARPAAARRHRRLPRLPPATSSTPCRSTRSPRRATASRSTSPGRPGGPATTSSRCPSPSSSASAASRR